MEINDVKQDAKKEIQISVRTSKYNSDWMKKNKVSPSKVFNNAINELIDQQVAEEIAEKVKPKKKK